MTPEQIQAFQNHDHPEIKKILEGDFKGTDTDAQGNTALHLVCAPRSIRKESGLVIDWVAGSGDGLDVPNAQGWTPLTLAVLLLPVELIEILPLKDAPSRAHAGDQALRLAAIYERADVVSALMKSGAKLCDPPPADNRFSVGSKFEDHKTYLAQIDGLIGRYPTFDTEVACRSDVSPEDLTRLSLSKDKATRKSVALNPNTPADVLYRLAPEFPRAFFKNPAFDWLLLEDPDRIFNIKQGILKHIIGLTSCPGSILQWAAANGDDSEKLAVIHGPNINAELLRQVASHSSGRIQALAIAKNPESTAAELSAIVGCDVASDRLAAGHLNSDLKTLQSLAKAGDETVREHVKNHPNATAKLIQELAVRGTVVHRLR